MITNKLCNPTHKDVVFPYSSGINIRVPADSHIELTVDQMDDFRPGKPGSEEARKQLEYYGLFLFDGDRSYEEQALESLRSTFREKKSQYDGFIDRIRARAMESGTILSPDFLEEQKAKSGYKAMELDLEVIDKRIQFLSKEKGHIGKVKQALDPKKTCFATQPPREFPSETALEMFLLDKDPEFVKQHRALQKQMLEA